jgi:Tol biopolymer transport system component
VPTATATPAPSLRQVTSGGCCVEPFWSPDSQRLLYLDKPAPDAPAGFYSVNVQDGSAALYTDRLGLYSPDLTLRAYPDGEQTIVERLADGQRWVIPSEGRAVSFSPDGTQLAWTAGQSGPPFDTARREIWTSQVDGSQAKPLIQLYSGGFSGWFPDGRLLINGRMDLNEPQQRLWAYSPKDGSTLLLGSGERLRGVTISPGGSWVTYQVLFSANPEENGTWLVDTRNGEKRRLDLFGAYRWRDDAHLLLIPLDTSQPSHQLWQIEAATGQAQPLTDPAVTPFKIANGDWSVSPDGSKVAFVSAEDHNIWVIVLVN